MEDQQVEIQKSIYIEGIGTITSEGELNLDGLIKRLLKSKYIITGR